jgi:plastocyanin
MIFSVAFLFVGLLGPFASQYPGQIIEVTAGNYFFQMPATARPGLTTIRMRAVGPGGHLIDLYRLDGGHTASEFVAASAAKQPTPWAKQLGGPGFPSPGKTANATYILEPGKYAIICTVHDPKDNKPHYTKGMYSELTVAGPRVPGKLPTPDITVTEVEYKWSFSRPITSGRHILRVTNAGHEIHEMKFVRVLPGHTIAESVAWRRGQPRVDEEFATVTPMEPGVSIITTIDFPRGDYTVWCVPQMKHGMMQTLSVRGRNELH